MSGKGAAQCGTSSRHKQSTCAGLIATCAPVEAFAFHVRSPFGLKLEAEAWIRLVAKV